MDTARRCAAILILLVVSCRREPQTDRFGMFMELTPSEKTTLRKFLEQAKGRRVRVLMRKDPEAAQATREFIEVFRQAGWSVDVKDDPVGESDVARVGLPMIVVPYWPADVASAFEKQLREFGFDVELDPGRTLTGDLEGAVFEFRVGVDTRKLDRAIKARQRGR